MLLNRIYRRVFETGSVFASFLRIVHLRLKYPGAKINFGCRISSSCLISCTDDSSMILENVIIRQNAVLIADRGGKLRIVDSYIGFGCVIVAGVSIEIDENCALAEMVVIRDQDHKFGDGRDLRSSGMRHSPIKLGKNIWVGSKASILRGVTIGDNAVIGASAVVTKEIAAGSVAVGIPARVINQIDEVS